MRPKWLALVNRAAGGGRCGRLVDTALADLRREGVHVEPIATEHPGHATDIVRAAYADGRQHFLGVGGDGTSYEIVNGLFPAAENGPRPALAFLPLGTGNSFLRDFTHAGAAHTTRALVEDRRQPCDVLRLVHAEGVIHYLNLLSIGFAADVAVLVNRRFKRLGAAGYLLGVIVCLARLQRRSFPLRLDGGPLDARRCLFLTFNNSRYTGGRMLIAPQADTADGLIEFVRWGPIHRLPLLFNLHRLYDGTHIAHPQASRAAVRRVDFELEQPVDVMVDGEVLTLQCRTLDVLPSAMDVVV